MSKKPADKDDVLGVIGDLTDLISKRFDAVDKRFDKVEMELFNQGEDIKQLKSDMTEVKAKVSHVYDVLDAHMKRIEDILQENQMRDHQQQRLERWIFQLADAANIKLRYE